MAQQIKITQTSNADTNIGVPKNLTMAQQTPVEFLINELGEYFPDYIGGIELLVKEVKQMEKEHLMIAFNDGKVNSVLKKRNAEQYYNETYQPNKD
jgi:hypothetical protein